MHEDAFPPGTAHVRWLILDDLPHHVWPLWHALLDDAERARAARFLRDADRRQFIAAHMLLRLMLSWAVGGAPGGWQFVPSPYGKPELHPHHDLPAIRFNIAHTTNAVACAIVMGRSIGVDIEDGLHVTDPMEIAEACFSPAEIDELRAAPPARRLSMFLRLWTLKEAYTKAVGLGLSMSLDSFTVSSSGTGLSFRNQHHGDPEQWHVETRMCSVSHHLSVALDGGGPFSVRHDSLSLHEIERMIARASRQSGTHASFA